MYLNYVSVKKFEFLKSMTDHYLSKVNFIYVIYIYIILEIFARVSKYSGKQ